MALDMLDRLDCLYFDAMFRAPVVKFNRRIS
jgi:hypothetical protein